MVDIDFRNSPLPVSLSIGDYNIDGFPDILAVTVNEDSGESVVRLIASVPCTKDLCTPLQITKERRALEWVSQGVSALNSVADVKKAVFMDFDEDVIIYAC